jgi:uncharacterized membrane protein
LTYAIRSRSPKTRIESLTDLIFGLALSIGSVFLLGRTPSSPEDVMVDLAWFGFSFLILISIWFRYTSIMSVLPVETGLTMAVNAVMLFLVSIEPYLLGLMAFGSFEASKVSVMIFVSEVYAFDLAGLILIMGLLAHQLTSEEHKLVKPELIHKYRRIRNIQYLAAGFFAITALPPFWVWEIVGTPLRFYLWYAILIFMWASRLSERVRRASH